jgi:hypothetical protein
MSEISLRGRETYKRLISSKKIGFIGALVLIFNAATGPGLPFTPPNFQNPGYLFTCFSFVSFAILSAFSVLLIVEAMQAIPGNRHFQGDVEYATMINFYFGPTAHKIGQLMLYGALQSNCIQGIVLSAQSIDNMLVGVFGSTCGLSLNLNPICVDQRTAFPSPFGDTHMLITVGFAVTIGLI